MIVKFTEPIILFFFLRIYFGYFPKIIYKIWFIKIVDLVSILHV